MPIINRAGCIRLFPLHCHSGNDNEVEREAQKPEIKYCLFLVGGEQGTHATPVPPIYLRDKGL